MTPFACSRALTSTKCIALAFLLAFEAGAPVWAANGAPNVTIWLMPNEPASTDTIESVHEEVEEFNREWGGAGPVTVQNTTVPALVDQLVVLNPQYATPEWAVVKGQAKTFEALKRFAISNGVHVYVRVLTWGAAFGEIQRSFEGGEGPDVLQIGSTWSAYFAARGWLQSAPRRESGSRWQPLDGVHTLPYIEDVRLLYYWKRLPSDPLESPEFHPDTSSWASFIRSLATYVKAPEQRTPRPPMVFPIILDINLLHDYAPLVWAGNGQFFDGRKMDIASAPALDVPRVIADNVEIQDPNNLARKYRLFAFPEVSHNRAMDLFLGGEYSALIEPVSALRYFSDRFTVPNGGKLTDYLGVSALPSQVTFKGGSHIVVSKLAKRDDLAFALAEYLCTDDQYTQMLASRGLLPAQRSGFGVTELLASISLDDSDLRDTLASAIASGREYRPSVKWPTELESTETLELMQSLWRRLGTGDSDEVAALALNTELTVNYRIDVATRWIWWARRVGIPSFAVLLVLTFTYRLFLLERASRAVSEKILHSAQGVLEKDWGRLWNGTPGSLSLSVKVDDPLVATWSNDFINELQTTPLEIANNPSKLAEDYWRKLFDRVKSWEFRYDLEPESDDRLKQRIRFPATIWAAKRGTCLDLACLFGAFARSARLTPLIVRLLHVNGKHAHAIAGCLLDNFDFEDISSPAKSEKPHISTVFEPNKCGVFQKIEVLDNDESRFVWVLPNDRGKPSWGIAEAIKRRVQREQPLHKPTLLLLETTACVKRCEPVVMIDIRDKKSEYPIVSRVGWDDFRNAEEIATRLLSEEWIVDFVLCCPPT